jgi:hypothetical protein
MNEELKRECERLKTQPTYQNDQNDHINKLLLSSFMNFSFEKFQPSEEDCNPSDETWE